MYSVLQSVCAGSPLLGWLAATFPVCEEYALGNELLTPGEESPFKINHTNFRQFTRSQKVDGPIRLDRRPVTIPPDTGEYNLAESCPRLRKAHLPIAT